MRTRKCTRYICDHCSRVFWESKRCIDHEPDCFRNPAREPKERELYPWPRRPKMGPDGNSYSPHLCCKDRDNWLGGCVWPKVEDWGDYDEPIISFTNAGWEPEDTENPHIRIGGQWLAIDWQNWEWLVSAMDDYRCLSFKLLIEEMYPEAECWWVGYKGTKWSLEISNEHIKRKQQECSIPF